MGLDGSRRSAASVAPGPGEADASRSEPKRGEDDLKAALLRKLCVCHNGCAWVVGTE